MSTLHRRNVLRLLGLGAVAAGSGKLLDANAAASATDAAGRHLLSTAPETGVAGEGPWWLVAPHRAGSELGGGRLERLATTSTGAVVAVFVTDAGDRFRVDVCRRDDSSGAPAPVARTASFDLFLANGGKGDKRTARREGLTVLALAETIRATERQPAPGFALLTMRERWARFTPEQLGDDLPA